MRTTSTRSVTASAVIPLLRAAHLHTVVCEDEAAGRTGIERVLNGETRFVPERFTRIYTNWMENIRDWCISRQFGEGHRIPVWYCQDCGEMICSRTDPEAHQLPVIRSVQDEDMLDTWVLSLARLMAVFHPGWPDKTEDLDYYYPTSVLVSGRDIIFFWVARMIFSGIEHTGKTPFAIVYIHGLVLDALGRKMSKSLDNGIDPIEVIEKYGSRHPALSLTTEVTLAMICASTGRRSKTPGTSPIRSGTRRALF